ncbi:hypothetical protein TNCV_4641081 [Trichonephila clavipes]|nr:hypothetical protein TNCV_4641081 [Trichonephila clavipes]
MPSEQREMSPKKEKNIRKPLERMKMWSELGGQTVMGQCSYSDNLFTQFSYIVQERDNVWLQRDRFTFPHPTPPWFPWNPNFEDEYPGGGNGLPSSLPLPPILREDLRLDGYLEYPVPQRYCTFANIHAYSGIRTQVLRNRSQRHSSLYQMSGVKDFMLLKSTNLSKCAFSAVS